MKKGGVFWISPAVWVLMILSALFTAASFFVNYWLFVAEVAVWLAVCLAVVARMARLKKDVSRYLVRIVGALDHSQRGTLENFPLPAVAFSSTGEILWYNADFLSSVLAGSDMYGESIGSVTGGLTAEELRSGGERDIRNGDKQYRLFCATVGARDASLFIAYYVDVTRLKEIEAEYELSRPAVMLVYIDNVEELTPGMRDSERAQIIGSIETMLEDWVSEGTGILKKYNHDWFQVVLEKRQLDRMIEKRFDILDRVRSMKMGEKTIGVTLSIGIGCGSSFKDNEQMARQAIEMALGRGGDQAAIKSSSGFEFYGGVSKGVEKYTKVRTRVMASALLELLENCDSVLVMGHRFSDLDCLGSAIALAAAAGDYGKRAFVVTDRTKTLAPELIERYVAAGQAGLFLQPEAALSYVTDRTLLIITDTHSMGMIESPQLLAACKSVAVIDHHRKMVDYIESATLFYHEPYASSASELVTELLPYLEKAHPTPLEAEALLSGIMLDTRSFVMKAGVRTFEAAAYLRKLGADTVEVKRLFSGTMDTYRKKSEIIAGVQIHGVTAIARYNGAEDNLRVAAAQAADELLSIKGIQASFTMFMENGAVNISARSFGEFNVQLVMEAIGGGGHQTSAGAQIKDATLDDAQALLTEAIDRYQESREVSLNSQSHE